MTGAFSLPQRENPPLLERVSGSRCSFLPVGQVQRLCVASIMSARRKGSWANRKIAFHEALYDVRVYTIMWLTPCYPG